MRTSPIGAAVREREKIMVYISSQGMNGLTIVFENENQSRWGSRQRERERESCLGNIISRLSIGLIRGRKKKVKVDRLIHAVDQSSTKITKLQEDNYGFFFSTG